MPMTRQNHSQHWVDQIVDQIVEWQKKNRVAKLHVDDMKTPSGRVHVGALRGVVIHDVVAKVLAQKTSQKVVSTYVFNDMDSMDKIPAYLPQDKYQDWLSKPLFKIPRPALSESGIDFKQDNQQEISEFEKTTSYAQFYALDFIKAFRRIGCSQDIIWSHQLYESGQMDSEIERTYQSLETFKKIYQDVADYQLGENWSPFRAFDLRPEVKSTRSYNWDGKTILVQSLDQNNQVVDEKRISPFGGTGKLLWKVDWPAHWKVLGVTIEGAGKDHTSAGGSRDMANAMCDQVFNITKPFDIQYEWILVRGAKMSSSKGVGTSARDFVNSFPPEIARFLFINKHYNQVIDFDPTTMAIPDLYDAYDQAARIFWQQEAGDLRLGRSFELSQVSKTPSAHFLPRFRDIITWIQDPKINVLDQATFTKGEALTDLEIDVLNQRKEFAQTWLEKFAPSEIKIEIIKELPSKVAQFSDKQHIFLRGVLQLLQSKVWQPEELQNEIYLLAKKSIGPKQAFKTIYQTFLGQNHGPKAAWLLLDLDLEFVAERINQIISNSSDLNSESSTQHIKRLSTDMFTIDAELSKKYPSISIGIAIIENVSIPTQSQAAQQFVSEAINHYSHLTTKTLGDYPEVLSYRQLYKQMGVKYHSRRPSPEALLRRIAQQKELYQVNPLVDAYNSVVIEKRVSVGAFDLAQVTTPTLLKEASGSEEILLLGDTEPTRIKSGEICYFDQSGPYNLDFNYRDAQRTAISPQTNNVLINVDGVFDITPSQVQEALELTIDRIIAICGGTVKESGVVLANT